MLDKKDTQWWVLEAQKHPESAADLIRTLAHRLAFIEKQNEELRGELITLRRKQRGDSPDITGLQQRVLQLEDALRRGKTAQQLIVYGSDRIECSGPLDNEPGRELPSDVAMLVCDALAQLLIITAETQVFSMALDDLPVPQGVPALLGNPRNVAAILEQTAIERSRFLTLLTQHGYVYSLLAGTVQQVARKRDKLVRNLIPGDPVVAALPSYNGDLLAISQKGRWTRFAEKSIAGSGSLAIELPKGDALVSLVPLSRDADIVLISEDGRAFVRPSADLKSHRIGTPGGMIVKGQTLRGAVVGDDVLVLTRLGHVLTFRTAELPFKAQTESGAPLPGLIAGDSALAITCR